MLKASPSSRAPGQCRGAAGMLLFCMDLASPEAAATRKLARSSSGTCAHAGLGSCLPVLTQPCGCLAVDRLIADRLFRSRGHSTMWRHAW